MARARRSKAEGKPREEPPYESSSQKQQLLSACGWRWERAAVPACAQTTCRPHLPPCRRSGPYNGGSELTLFTPSLSRFSSRASSRTGLNCFRKVRFRLRAASTFCCQSLESSGSATEDNHYGQPGRPKPPLPKRRLHPPGPHSASGPGLQPESPGLQTPPECPSLGQMLRCSCSRVPLPQAPSPPPGFSSCAVWTSEIRAQTHPKLPGGFQAF